MCRVGAGGDWVLVVPTFLSKPSPSPPYSAPFSPSVSPLLLCRGGGRQAKQAAGPLMGP